MSPAGGKCEVGALSVCLQKDDLTRPKEIVFVRGLAVAVVDPTASGVLLALALPIRVFHGDPLTARSCRPCDWRCCSRYKKTSSSTPTGGEHSTASSGDQSVLLGANHCGSSVSNASLSPSLEEEPSLGTVSGDGAFSGTKVPSLSARECHERLRLNLPRKFFMSIEGIGQLCNDVLRRVIVDRQLRKDFDEMLSSIQQTANFHETRASSSR